MFDRNDLGIAIASSIKIFFPIKILTLKRTGRGDPFNHVSSSALTPHVLSSSNQIFFSDIPSCLGKASPLHLKNVKRDDNSLSSSLFSQSDSGRVSWR